MGFIRLLLALSVVLAHAGPLFGLTLIGGKMAVQSFFIISGFYMALILNEKYIGKNGSYRLYITNRFLRIFPLYWLIFLATCLFHLIFQNGFEILIQTIASYHPLTSIFLGLTNVFIFGQDLGMFLEVNKQGLLVFSTTYEGTTPFVYLHLIVPQGWTLAVELTFYILAPFLVKQRFWILAVMASLSISLRLFLYSQGLHHEPWTNRFFPTELLFFLIGIFSYRFFKLSKHQAFNPRFILLLYGVLICMTLFYAFLPKVIGVFDLFQWVYYMTLAVSIPFIFYFFKKNTYDAFLGELAYPVFVSHFLVLQIVTHFLPDSLSQFLVVLTLCFTLILSVLILKLIEPLNQLRQKRVLAVKNK